MTTNKGIRFTEEEYKPIEEKLTEYNLNFSDYVRALIENDLYFSDLLKRNLARNTIKEIKGLGKQLNIEDNELLQYVNYLYYQKD